MRRHTCILHVRCRTNYHISFRLQLPIGYFALDCQCHYIYIKVVPLSSSEWQIIQFLSTDPLRADIRNHTILNMSIIPAGEWVFFVQAFWYDNWVLPPFDTVNSRLKMSRQLLEGLAFMHEHGIGHGDIHPGNLLWNHDGTRGNGVSCFVEPGHIAVPFQSTFDVRFAFIDFGFLVRFDPGDTKHLAEPGHCPPDEFAAPEQFRTGEQYDLFALDVYNLGRVLEHELEEATKTESFVCVHSGARSQNRTSNPASNASINCRQQPQSEPQPREHSQPHHHDL